MVGRFFRMIHREVRGLHEAAYLLGLFTLGAQLLALVRDRLLAGTFGAGELLDVYYAAFRIPDVVFATVASLVSVYVLIPFLAERSEQSEDSERELVHQVFTVFSVFLLLVSAVLFVAMPVLSAFLFPSLFAAGLGEDLILLSRILLLQPLFLGLSNLFGAVTQSRQKFILFAISPLLYTLGIIVGIVALYPLYGLSGLAWGVVLGALLHAAIQIPFIVEHRFFPRFRRTIDWNEIRRVLFLSLPRTLALAADKIVLLFLVAFAALLPGGSISVFNLSFNLQSVPFAIVAVSYSVAAFPTLARLFSSGERDKFFLHIITAARHIIFWSLPAIALFIVLRAQIVRVILGVGEFDWNETRLTAAALAIFSVSLLAQGLSILFIRGYYAAGKTRRPLFIVLMSAAMSVTLAFVLLRLFESVPVLKFFIEGLLKVEGLSGTAVLMLPLAYSVSSLFAAGLFWILFQRDFEGFSASLLRPFFHSFSASVFAGLAAYLGLNVFNVLFDINTLVGIFLQGFLAGLIGIVIGILTLVALRSAELSEVSRTFHHKFWRARTIAPEQTEL